jgi:DNA-directed RNA polymerase specialized sigma24 family protein
MRLGIATIDDTSFHLIAHWRAGDPRGADELVGRYYESLVALVRGRLSLKLARRLDPEDVVQSAFCRFFTCARAGRYTDRSSGDLHKLLVAITLHCLGHEVKRHTADKRSVDRERSLSVLENNSVHALVAIEARVGEPSCAVAAAEAWERILARLSPLHRRMVELRAQGYRIEEIAAATHRSDRLIHQVLGRVKVKLSPRE